VTRAGVAAEPPNDGGATVEEVQQGCRLWHRRRTGRALGKARGRWSSWGSSASSRRQRWLDVVVLRGGDDGVVAGGDPGEVLGSWRKRERLGTNQIWQKIERNGTHHDRVVVTTAALILACPVANSHGGAVKRHRGATRTAVGARFQWISRG
jgi:hypothetical protein